MDLHQLLSELKQSLLFELYILEDQGVTTKIMPNGAKKELHV